MLAKLAKQTSKAVFMSGTSQNCCHLFFAEVHLTIFILFTLQGKAFGQMLLDFEISGVPDLSVMKNTAATHPLTEKGVPDNHSEKRK